MEPTIYQVKPEQVGNEDLSDFLRKAIGIQFTNKEYFIANEQMMEKRTSYSKDLRKIRAFVVQDNTDHVTHNLFFDVTEVGLARGGTWGLG